MADTPYFFGREAETRRLALRVAQLRAQPGHGVVALIGPSAACGTSAWKGGAGFVASGSSGMVRLWRLDVAAAKQWLCDVPGDPLTVEECARYLPGVQPVDPC